MATVDGDLVGRLSSASPDSISEYVPWRASFATTAAGRQLLVTLGRQPRCLETWDLATGSILGAVGRGVTAASSVVTAPVGGGVVALTVDRDGWIIEYDLQTQRRTASWGEVPDPLHALATGIGPGGRQVLVAGTAMGWLLAWFLDDQAFAGAWRSPIMSATSRVDIEIGAIRSREGPATPLLVSTHRAGIELWDLDLLVSLGGGIRTEPLAPALTIPMEYPSSPSLAAEEGGAAILSVLDHAGGVSLRRLRAQ